MAAHLARERPDRVRSLVYGGHVLFDAAAVLAALGMAPDVEARDAAERRAAAGDWAGFWETFPVPIPEAMQKFLQEGNDPAVQTAAAQGSRMGSMVWQPPSVTALAYWGEGEIFHELNVENAAPPLEWFTVAGGHADGFFPAEPVLAGVRPFLEAQA